jgi:hypothetical protein
MFLEAPVGTAASAREGHVQAQEETQEEVAMPGKRVSNLRREFKPARRKQDMRSGFRGVMDRVVA